MVRAAVLGGAVLLLSCGAVAPRPIGASELEPPSGDDVLEVRVTEATVTQKQRPLLEISAQPKKKEA